jgi:hypothetical protein
MLHRVPDAQGNIEEAFLATLAPSAHKTDGGVRSLAKRLQLRLQL